MEQQKMWLPSVHMEFFFLLRFWLIQIRAAYVALVIEGMNQHPKQIVEWTILIGRFIGT